MFVPKQTSETEATCTVLHGPNCTQAIINNSNLVDTHWPFHQHLTAGVNNMIFD